MRPGGHVYQVAADGQWVDCGLPGAEGAWLDDAPEDNHSDKAFTRTSMPDRAVEPHRLYGPRVAALRNQATYHTGDPPAPGPHSSARTRRQAPKIAGKKLLKASTTTAENSFLPAIHAQEMAFVVP